MKVGKYIQQPKGFKAFVPDKFPSQDGYNFGPELIEKATTATLLLGKLDGITQLLPDVDFFILMYIRKDATSSSQIEGTQATIADVIEAEAKTSVNLPNDVDDILHYIEALNYGTNRLSKFPMSLRVICEIHGILMKSARSSHYPDPGNFRQSQNWIGGTTPMNASFVPPPVFEMKNALNDLEKFFHQKSTIPPIIQAALIHAQFETIHPFLDGNGRTGRILITLFLWLQKILEKPVLFLSSYFHKHQKVYYKKIDEYHEESVEKWVDFFLDGVIDTAKEAIETVKQINLIREEDMRKIQCMSKASSGASMKVIQELFKTPIINISFIQKITGFTRQGANNVVNRFIELGILEVRPSNTNYNKTYIYRRYYDVFVSKE